MERAAEGVEYQTQDLERDDAEQGFCVARLAQDYRRVAFALRKREVALRHGAADGRAVGEDELHLPLGGEADGVPHGLREERVGGPAIDQEADGRLASTRAADDTLDVADAHLRKMDADRRTASSEDCAEARGYARRGLTPLSKATTPSVVIPRLQEVDAIVADEVDDPVLGREPATPHVRPEVFQRFRLADPTERVAHDRLDDRQRAAGRARIRLDPPREVVAELRLEDRDPPTAT